MLGVPLSGFVQEFQVRILEVGGKVALDVALRVVHAPGPWKGPECLRMQ